jgi:hypothetical protein
MVGEDEVSFRLTGGEEPSFGSSLSLVCFLEFKKRVEKIDVL